VDEDATGFWATHVFFLDDSVGWVSSDRAEGLFCTQDRGKNWKKVGTPVDFISGIFFADRAHGLILDSVEGRVFETQDGGQSWKWISKERIRSAEYLRFFEDARLSRWNDFAVHRVLVLTDENAGP
jgi:photosystem II stability/assembly factor-like uncharacterized protein